MRLISRSNCGILEFQRSAGNRKDEVRFTVNVGVVYGALLEPGRTSLESATTVHAHLRERISALLPEPRSDGWWLITGATDVAALEDELAQAILKSAVPYLHHYLDIKAAIALWQSGQSPGLTRGERDRLLARAVAGVPHD